MEEQLSSSSFLCLQWKRTFGWQTDKRCNMKYRLQTNDVNTNDSFQQCESDPVNKPVYPPSELLL